MPKPVRIFLPQTASALSPRLLEDMEEGDRLLLIVEKALTTSELNSLTEQIKSIRLHRLTLDIRLELLQSDAFINMIALIPRQHLRYVELVFPKHELTKCEIAAQIEHTLTTVIAPRVDFVLMISTVDIEERLREPDLDKTNHARCNRTLLNLCEFEKQIIDNIHARPATEVSQVIAIRQGEEELLDSPSKPKIRLKALIESSLDCQEGNALMRPELQHVEQAEVSAVQMIEAEHHVEVMQDTYTGETLDYEQFKAKAITLSKQRFARYFTYNIESALRLFEPMMTDKYATTPAEANIPIKFLSPAAAEFLGKNLPQFTAINLHNLPQGFLLKKAIDPDQSVLDYNPLWEGADNPFTPTDTFIQDEEEERYYQVDLNPLLSVPSPKTYAWGKYIVENHPNFINAWIQYGTQGLDAISFALESLEQTCAEEAFNQPKRLGRHLKILYKIRDSLYAYLTSFDYAPLFQQNQLSQFVARIMRYDDNQREALANLLNQTFACDLIHFLDTFDVFWQAIETLCANRYKTYRIEVKAYEIRVIDNNPDTFFSFRLLKHDSRIEVYWDAGPKNTSTFRRFDEFEHSKDMLRWMNLGFNTQAIQTWLPDWVNRAKLQTAYIGTILEREARDRIRYANGRLFYTPSTLMERLLTTLTNTRNLDEQIAYMRFSGLTDYRVYNAIVQKQLKLYHGIQDRDYRIWPKEKVTLEALSSLSMNFQDAKVFNATWSRYLGQQSDALPYPILFAPDRMIGSMQHGLLSFPPVSYFIALLFISHSQAFDDLPTLYDDWSNLLASCTGLNHHDQLHTRFLQAFCQDLIRLHHMGLRLNIHEGALFCYLLFAEVTREPVLFNQSLHQSLHQLEMNPEGTRRWLRARESNATRLAKTFTQAIPLGHFRGVSFFEHKGHSLHSVFTLAERLAKTESLFATFGEHLVLLAELMSLQGIKDEEVVAIESLLIEASQAPAPNPLHYAVTLIIQSAFAVKAEVMLQALKETQALTGFEPTLIKGILQRHGFCLSEDKTVEVRPHDDREVKEAMVSLLVLLEFGPRAMFFLAKEAITRRVEVAAAGVEESKTSEEEQEVLTHFHNRHAELESMSFMALQTAIQRELSNQGFVFQGLAKSLLQKVFMLLRWQLLNQAFSNVPPEIKDALEHLPGLNQAVHSFEDMATFKQISQGLANVIPASLFWQQPERLAPLLQAQLPKFDYKTLHYLFQIIKQLPQAYQVCLFEPLLLNKTAAYAAFHRRFIDLLNHVQTLLVKHFNPTAIEQYIRFVGQDPVDDELLSFIIARHAKDREDPFLRWFFQGPIVLASDVIKKILTLSDPIKDKALLCEWLSAFPAQDLPDMLVRLDRKSPSLLTLLAKSFSTRLPSQRAFTSAEWIKLITLFDALKAHEQHQLGLCYERMTPNMWCLLHALETRGEDEDFLHFLHSFETAPFGPRNIQEQFDTRQVERIVNQSLDLFNESPHDYAYRLQWLQTFLFVNHLGYTRPFIHGKPIKDWKNDDIQSLFLALKQGYTTGHFEKGLADLSPNERLGVAFALMREALYRATGQFPNSTQLLSLLQGALHEQDMLSNIDTGQGKSLIDMMKAAFLWLTHTRVDMTTSSITDAKRDIEHYGTFLTFLSIPYGHSPILSSSDRFAFVANGVNFSTFAQLSLFFAKAYVLGYRLDEPQDKLALIVNESDYSLLDDRTIYRYATAAGCPVKAHQVWLYDAINAYVCEDKLFKTAHFSQDLDILRLKRHVKQYARTQQKKLEGLGPFSDAQWLLWIESALLVNYKLKENTEYIIPEAHESVMIFGKSALSHVTKVLMIEADIKGKASPDAKFGNGIQQLLYAQLNCRYPSQHFVIEPETKTLLSSNNRNLMDYYRRRKARIWGSSGTVGSSVELQELHAKFALAGSKIEPHHPKQVVVHAPLWFKNEAEQFKALSKALMRATKPDNAPSQLVFCKDIDMVHRFHQFLQKQKASLRMQCYTGHGHEETVIEIAANAGMITNTTAAIGRNTDVPYDKTRGMGIWHTRVNASRVEKQHSGRTGRQGSPGDVHYFFNLQDVPHQDIPRLQQAIDDKAVKDRRYNETLFTLLNALFDMALMPLPLAEQPTFISTRWAPFSTACERLYRENNDDFLPCLINKAKTEGILPPDCQDAAIRQALEQTLFAKPPRYGLNPTAVRIEKTQIRIPPYLWLQDTPAEPLSTEEVATIKDNVQRLLWQLPDKKSRPPQLGYLYLEKNALQQAQIREIHQAVLTDFLNQAMQKTPWYARWKSHAPHLRAIKDNPNTLVFFHALATIPCKAEDKTPLIPFKLMQTTLLASLNDYLDHAYWPISQDRKRFTHQLIQDITKASCVTEILHSLSRTQQAIIKQDIITNRTRFKKLHFFTPSRLQAEIKFASEWTAMLG